MRALNELLADALHLTADETERMTQPRELAELLETVKARHALALSTWRLLAGGEP